MYGIVNLHGIHVAVAINNFHTRQRTMIRYLQLTEAGCGRWCYKPDGGWVYISFGRGINRLESLHFRRIGFAGPASTMDCVVHHNHDPTVFCIRAGGNLYRFIQISWSICADGSAGAHGACKDNRVMCMQDILQKKRGFLHCVRAMGNNHSIGLMLIKRGLNTFC